MRLRWSDSLSVGDVEIDEQHRRFVDALNELQDALKQEGPASAAKAGETAFKRLEDYVENHFATEEAFMEKVLFPGFSSHVQVHREFIDLLTQLRAKRGCDGLHGCADLIGLMMKWARDHITVEDRKYADFIASTANRERGASSVVEKPSSVRPFLADALWQDTLAGLLVVDAATHTIVDINEKTSQMLGRSRDEVIGRNCHLFICPSQQGACPITDKGLAVDCSERMMLDAKGNEVPILKSVRTVRVDGRDLLLESFVDTTQLKETQRALKDSQGFIRSVIDGIGDPVLVIDPRDHRIVLANRAVTEAAGADPVEAGLKCYQASHRVDSPCEDGHTPCPLREVVSTGRAARATHIHYDRQGNKLFTDVLATPVFDEQGRVVRVIESNRDITMHKKTEMSLQKSQAELQRQYEELQKIDLMKEALISNVSHELKTPVAKHAMQLEVLKGVLSRQDCYDEVKENIGVIESTILRQQSVIRNILMVSRLESGGKRLTASAIRIDGLIDEVIEDYIHTIDTLGVGFEVKLSKAVVHADRDMLWHVFSNIVNNAIKYRSEVDPRIEIVVLEADGLVRVAIADNGVGFNAEEKENAFERFYQSSSSREGLGIGLNIAHIIVEQMGGSISIDSPGKGQGSTVLVILPTSTPHGTTDDSPGS